MSTEMPARDPQEVSPVFFVWCSDDGTNDGSANDTGELQGETIASYTVTVQTGLTKDSDAKTAVTIQGVTYDANTAVTVWLSGGTVETDYTVNCQIVTSGATPRTLERTMIIPVRSL